MGACDYRRSSSAASSGPAGVSGCVRDPWSEGHVRHATAGHDGARWNELRHRLGQRDLESRRGGKRLTRAESLSHPRLLHLRRECLLTPSRPYPAPPLCVRHTPDRHRCDRRTFCRTAVQSDRISAMSPTRQSFTTSSNLWRLPSSSSAPSSAPMPGSGRMSPARRCTQTPSLTPP